MSTYKMIQPFAAVEVSLRFFGRQIQRNVDECVRVIAETVARRKSEVSAC